MRRIRGQKMAKNKDFCKNTANCCFQMQNQNNEENNYCQTNLKMSPHFQK